jgi:hypothetical protein
MLSVLRRRFATAAASAPPGKKTKATATATATTATTTTTTTTTKAASKGKESIASAAAAVAAASAAAAKKAQETALQSDAPETMRVAWNNVASLRIAHVERRFEAFKAQYEAPIAARYAATIAPRLAAERDTVRLERQAERRELKAAAPTVDENAVNEAKFKELSAALLAPSPTAQQVALGATLDNVGTTVESLLKQHDDVLSPDELDQRIMQELNAVGIATLKRAELAAAAAAAGSDVAQEAPEDGDGDEIDADAHALLNDNAFVLITHDRRFDVGAADSPFKKQEAILKQRRVVLLVSVEALRLPKLAEERLIELVGVRYHADAGMIKLSADAFTRRSENTHAVLRTMKELINEAFLADSNYVPPARSTDGAQSPFEAAAAEEAAWFAQLRAKGVELDSPLQVGPALAPIAFMERVQRDIELDQRSARGALLANEQPRLRLFHLEAVPTAAERTAADKQMTELVAQLQQQQQQQQR